MLTVKRQEKTGLQRVLRPPPILGYAEDKAYLMELHRRLGT